MTEPVYCVVDTESTGLDPRIHQPFEVSLWRDDAPEPQTFLLPHTLQYADTAALAVNRYIERAMRPWQPGDGVHQQIAEHLIFLLHGVHLIGANPGFDAAMLTRFIGTSVWHHRLTNVSEAARWIFGWSAQRGLADIRDHLGSLGYNIPAPDHTAEGDVRATRAIYDTLVLERAKLRPFSD